METSIDAALLRCLQLPSVPQYIDRHDWPVRLLLRLLRADESKALEVESEMKGGSLLLCCCSLGGGLPFAPDIVLQEKIMMQFCRRRKCTHYELVAKI